MTRIFYTALTGMPTKDGGGGRRIIHDLMQHIDRSLFTAMYGSFHGITATVPAQSAAPEGWHRSVKRSIPFHGELTRSRLYQYWYAQRLQRHFRRLATRCQTDIVHAHHPFPAPFFIDQGFKTVLSIHAKGGMANEMAGSGRSGFENEPVFREIARMERYAVDRADAITFPSRAAQDLFLRKNSGSTAVDRMEVIYNGIDVDSVIAIPRRSDVRSRYGIRSDERISLLNIADHNAQKNIPVLISAVERIVREHGQDALLINAGEGEATPRLKEMVRAAGLERHILFLGRIPNTDILQLMKDTDCFVLTSKDVVFDLVVLEALASETAVFVSDDGGNREIITHGSNGYLLGSDADAIARAIVGSDRDRVRAQALRSVQDFSVQRMVKSYEALYERVLKSRVGVGQ